MTLTTLLVFSCATLALGQRPFFAGSKPIGYPEVTTTEGLGDRFGEIDGTTQRLPIEANGDRGLVDRLSKLPIDQQPFWLINWLALEANRQKPQTYPQKPNTFIDPGTTGSNPSSSFNSGKVPESRSSGSPGSSGSSTSAGSTGFVSNNRFGSSDLSGNSVSSVSSGTSSSTENAAVYGFVKPNRYSAEEHPRKDQIHQTANEYKLKDVKKV